VLKYYKVDENGKITRLRSECPGEACGGGVFMATHFDRHYCGKCYKTVSIEMPKGGYVKPVKAAPVAAAAEAGTSGGGGKKDKKKK